MRSLLCKIRGHNGLHIFLPMPLLKKISKKVIPTSSVGLDCKRLTFPFNRHSFVRCCSKE
jgi:hypothetical protein